MVAPDTEWRERGGEIIRIAQESKEQDAKKKARRLKQKSTHTKEDLMLKY